MKGCLEVLVQCSVYWVRTMLSSINFNGKNVVYSGLIISFGISCSLICNTLANILYITERRVTGLQ